MEPEDPYLPRRGRSARNELPHDTIGVLGCIATRQQQLVIDDVCSRTAHAETDLAAGRRQCMKRSGGIRRAACAGHSEKDAFHRCQS